jgi:hypothetical protein
VSQLWQEGEIAGASLRARARARARAPTGKEIARLPKERGRRLLKDSDRKTKDRKSRRTEERRDEARGRPLTESASRAAKMGTVPAIADKTRFQGLLSRSLAPWMERTASPGT